MSFPKCKHARRKKRQFTSPLAWLGSEPYRLFFLSGAIFAILGVLMWPLFYEEKLSFYPGLCHAHVMIQTFGGAFVIGFLGTAGPRMIGAPRLHPWELLTLFGLHLANGISHLRGLQLWGDRFFVATIGFFAVALAVRLIFFRKELPPPPLLLAATGLLCGLAGTLIWINPDWMRTMEMFRLGRLLLNQGFLLGPIMGVGIFLFPRLLGNDFGEPKSREAAKKSWYLMSAVALIFLGSFPVQVWGSEKVGVILRVLAFVIALAQVDWGFSKTIKETTRQIFSVLSGRAHWRTLREGNKMGTLANALRFFCIPLALIGLLSPVLMPDKQVALLHLLFVGGFGLVCLIAASRVIFGHSGRVERFENRSWIARLIVFILILASLTRVSADFLPRVTITHYEYAAWSWAGACTIWIVWHSHRFFKKDEE